jgi:DNA-binding Lrp family transcriptional regulator
LPIRELDRKILSKLLKNSRLSDRQVAKLVGASQPTVTRRRAILEKEIIEGYTTIPKWDKLGYEIIAITFLKSRVRFSSQTKKEKATEKGSMWVMKQPNIIMVSEGNGLGKNGVIISVHIDYSDYSEFLTKLTSSLSDIVEEPESFIVGTRRAVKPFNFKYVADHRIILQEESS